MEKAKVNQDREKDMDVEQKIERITNIIRGSVNKRKRKCIKKKDPWFNYKCERHRRKNMKELQQIRKNSTEENRILYLEGNKLYNNTCRAEKANYFLEKALNIAKCKNTKDLWKEIKHLRGRKKLQSNGSRAE